MTNNSKKSQSKKRRVMLFLFSLLTFIIFLASYFYLTKTTVDTQRQLLRAEAQNATEHINDWLRKLAEIGDRLALTLGRPDCENIEAAILQEIRKNPNVYGIGAAYLPNEHDKKRRLYAPYYVRRDKKHRLIYVEDEYDYSSGGHSWFDQPLKQKRECGTNPFMGGPAMHIWPCTARPLSKRIAAAGKRRSVLFTSITALRISGNSCPL